MASLPFSITGNGTQLAWKHAIAEGVGAVAVNGVPVTFTDVAGVVTLSAAPAAGAQIVFYPTVQANPSGPAALAKDRWRIVSLHGGYNSRNATLSNGTSQTSATNLLTFKVNTECTDLRFMMAGSAGSSAGESQVGNPVPLFMALRAQNRQVPITFPLPSTGAQISASGGVGHVMPDGAVALSNPITQSDASANGLPGGFNPGTNYQYTIHVAVSAGQKWPLAHSDGDYQWITGGVNRTTDQVYGSGIKTGADNSWPLSAVNNLNSGSAFAAGGYCYGATAIIGRQLVATSVVMICGHSIAWGAASTPGAGWIGLGLEDAGVAFHNDALAGSTLANQITYGVGVIGQLSRYVDHIIVQGITNDAFSTGARFTLAQLKASLLAWCRLVGRPDVPIWPCTEFPRPRGPLGNAAWAGGVDTASQSIDTNQEPVRLGYNNWLRDPGPKGARAYLKAHSNGAFIIGGIIDPTPIVERNLDGSVPFLDAAGQQASGTGGYWLPSGALGVNYYTGDGIHPNANAVALLRPFMANFAFSGAFALPKVAA